jgi:hypothetical protein
VLQYRKVRPAKPWQFATADGSAHCAEAFSARNRCTRTKTTKDLGLITYLCVSLPVKLDGKLAYHDRICASSIVQTYSRCCSLCAKTSQLITSWARTSVLKHQKTRALECRPPKRPTPASAYLQEITENSGGSWVSHCHTGHYSTQERIAWKRLTTSRHGRLLRMAWTG